MKFVRCALVGSILIFTLACGKKFQVKSPPSQGISQDTPASPHEKRENVEDIGQFYRVKRGPKSPSTLQAQKVKIAEREYKIERERLQFANLTYDFNDNQMILRGQILLNSQLENFEMSGKIENDMADLKLVDPQSPFRDRLKARATCYSLTRNDKGQCQRFFVDFYYYDQGVFYTEQLIPKLESLIKEEKQEERKEQPKEEMLEHDEIDSSEPGFFSVQNDQDIIELFPEISEQPSVPEVSSPSEPLPTPPVTVPSRPQPAPQPSPKPNKPPQAPSKTSPKKSVRPTNQAVGGREGEVPALRNASNLLEVQKKLGKTAGFQLVNQANERYYGTWDMVQFIKTMANWVKVNGPGQPLSVGNISSKEGGEQVVHKEDGSEVKIHASHQNGLDVDIAYFTKDSKKIMTQIVNVKTNKLNSEILADEQIKLFKYMISTNDVNVIIVDHVIKTALCKKATEMGEINGNDDNALTVRTFNRLVGDRDPRRNHGTHFHVRLNCGKFNRSCYQKSIPDQGLGCEK